MKIIINGQMSSVDASMLDLAMAELGFADQSVAAALNGEFVPHTDWSVTHLNEGDALEVLAPMQGG